MKVRVMRNFRLRHKIPLEELARQGGCSAQWLSQAELKNIPLGDIAKAKILGAFQGVLESRGQALSEMRADFRKTKNRFFKEENEWTDL